MTPEQLFDEIFRRLRERFPEPVQPPSIEALRTAVDVICVDLGLGAGSVVLRPSATHAGRIDYLVMASAERIAALPFPLTITREEVKAAVLGAVASGDVDDLSYLDWWEVNEPEVRFGDWRLTLFIEAGGLHDIYGAEAPDGRTQDFPHHSDPLDLFSRDEVETVARALGCTRVAC